MTTAPDTLPDFRTQLATAQDWVASLIEQVTPDQLSKATPCTEFDVRELIAHVYMGAHRVTGMAAGADASTILFPVEQLPEDLAGGYRAAIAESQAAWTDDRLLAQMMTAPFGTMPGAALLGAYTMEALAHGWDLAKATGQPTEIEPELAGLALDIAQRTLPAEGREFFPFDDVVPSAEGATVTTRFVNWTGRG